MFKDLNRPEGLWGDVQDRQTSAKSKFVTKPYQSFTQWESQAISYIVAEELLKEITKKYN